MERGPTDVDTSLRGLESPTRARHTLSLLPLGPRSLTPHPPPTLRRSLSCSTRPPSSPSQPPTGRAAPRTSRRRNTAASRQRACQHS
eukprot:scaffold13206_cov67-Phaeocystis_antarctica.AAC.1